jgi:hypothetical protein
VPIALISAQQFADQIKAGITSRDRSYEVSIGEVPDLAIFPQARVLERERIALRQVNLMLTLLDPTVFEGEFAADLNGIVFNEGITASPGGRATATAVFSRSAAPTTDIRVQRGFPI